MTAKEILFGQSCREKMLKGANILTVITSYSIHYTKLYDGCIPRVPRINGLKPIELLNEFAIIK